MTELSFADLHAVAVSFDEVPATDFLDTFPEIENPRVRREKQMTLYLLRRFLGLRDVDKLRHDPDGAPYIEGGDCHISISHSHHEVALLSGDNPCLGVDVESPRENLLKVASRFLTLRELAYYTTLPLLLRAWTIKEAAYKALHIKELSSQDIHLSCQEPDGATDHATVGSERLDIFLQPLPTGSLMAIALKPLQ